jgi:1,4-dihydroxy-2-naphthoyl-CoA hydrolase
MEHASPEDAVAAVNGYRGALAESMGIVITEVSTARVAATMPVAGNTQPFGLLHGGASAVLAETVGSIAAAIHGGPDHAPVGVSLHCTHHKGAREGSVHAAAVPVRLGRTLTTHSIDITDDDGDLVCSATLTCFLRPQAAP